MHRAEMQWLPGRVTGSHIPRPYIIPHPHLTRITVHNDTTIFFVSSRPRHSPHPTSLSLELRFYLPITRTLFYPVERTRSVTSGFSLRSSRKILIALRSFLREKWNRNSPLKVERLSNIICLTTSLSVAVHNIPSHVVHGFKSSPWRHVNLSAKTRLCVTDAL